MQDCIDSCGKSYSTQTLIKNLFNYLDHFVFGNVSKELKGLKCKTKFMKINK